VHTREHYLLYSIPGLTWSVTLELCPGTVTCYLQTSAIWRNVNGQGRKGRKTGAPSVKAAEVRVLSQQEEEELEKSRYRVHGNRACIRQSILELYFWYLQLISF
jgi:hypothetical protein